MWRPDSRWQPVTVPRSAGAPRRCRGGRSEERLKPGIPVRRARGSGILALAFMLWFSGPLAAAEPSELEAQLERLRADIARIQTRLDSDLASRDELRLELAQAERAVAEADRNQRATQAALAATQTRIHEIEVRIAAIQADAARVTEVLGAQLRLAHQQGGQSRLKLLLNLDDPRELARQMAYHGYLSRARLGLLADLEDLQQRQRDSRRELDRELAQLSELEGRQREEMAALRSARQERDQTMQQLQSQIESQAAQLAAMERDAAELEELIEQLAQALREIPMDIEVPSILSLQGQLPLPAQGPLKRRFGDARGGELRWNGWLIGAAAGAAVRAIAHGRVAYADWLRGYGMLLIIDHGDGVMSLYGHNESLLHRVGDWVAVGDEVAVVGQSGGGEAGLYFELRRDGRPVNPGTWLVRP